MLTTNGVKRWRDHKSENKNLPKSFSVKYDSAQLFTEELNPKFTSPKQYTGLCETQDRVQENRLIQAEHTDHYGQN